MSEMSGFQALAILAEEFVSTGHFLQAIKCLEAICQSPEVKLPLFEVEVRLRLATLLLQHTDVTLRAKAQLEQCTLQLKNLPTSAFGLKCRVYNRLAQCYGIYNYDRQQKQTIKKGLELCVNARVSGLADLGVWEAHFHLETAHASVREGALDDAQPSMRQALEASARCTDMYIKAVTTLANIQLVLLSGSDDAAFTNAVAIFEPLIPHLQQLPQAYEIQLHFQLLRALWLTRKSATADQGELNKMIRPTVEVLLKSIQPQHEQTSLSGAYRWLPPALLQAAVTWVSAVCLRPSGKFSDALTHIDASLEAVDRELHALSILPTLSEPNGMVSEDELPQVVAYKAKPFLVLKFHLLEHAALISLTQMQITKAQQEIALAVHMVKLFPAALGPLKTSMHLLLGLYCHAVSMFPHAMQHFTQAKDTAKDACTHSLASIHLAVSALCCENIVAHSAAQDVLGPLLRTLQEKALPTNQAAAVLFGSAVAALAQAAPEEAHTKLTEALKAAHGNVGNHQLVVQCLALLGNIAFSRGDRPQGMEMLKNAGILSRHTNDLLLQILVLQKLPTSPNTAYVSPPAAVQNDKHAPLVCVHQSSPGNGLGAMGTPGDRPGTR